MRLTIFVMYVCCFLKMAVGEFVWTDSLALKLRDKLHQTARSSAQLFLVECRQEYCVDVTLSSGGVMVI